MRTDVSEAIETARTVNMHRPMTHRAEPQRNHSREHVLALVRAVARELPADMTLGELLEEIGE